MKRRSSLLATLLCLMLTGNAQKHDYVWLSGYDSHVGFSNHWGFYFGTSVIDFNYSIPKVSYDTLKMNFTRTNTSFCDSDGNLLFYTNGIYIANSLDEKIENSDSMNAGYVQYVWAPDIQNYGYRSREGIYCFSGLKEGEQNRVHFFFIHG